MYEGRLIFILLLTSTIIYATNNSEIYDHAQNILDYIMITVDDNERIDNNLFSDIQNTYAQIYEKISKNEAQRFAESTLETLNQQVDSFYESIDLKKNLIDWLTAKKS